MAEPQGGGPEEFVRPENVIEDWGLKKGDHVADFGSGHGFLTLPIARAVGAEGKVYALDIQKPTLDIIRSRARLLHLLNIECIWADLEHTGGSKLKDAFIDFVVIANIAFQVESKDVMFKEAHRILRPTGRLAVIEWNERSRIGPPRELRVPKKKIIELAQLTGFHFDREFNADANHYGILFAK